MPRSLWSGSLSFGLVNVPVQLTSAVRDVDLRFRQLHAEDNVPIDVRRYCSEEDVEVPYEEVARGYELDDGGQVVLTDEDLAAAEPRKTRTIDIEQFVDLAEVDPIFFDHPYFVLPAAENEGAARAYALLVDVMRRAGRAALGRFVMRNKEYLALIRVRDERLALTTMRFHDEVRERTGIGDVGAKPARDALDAAVGLVNAMTVEWDPARYDDCYRERLQAVIDRKKAGQRVQVPAEEEAPGPVPDLMAALERSLADMRARAGGGDGSGGGDGGSRLTDLTRDELYERAQDEEIPGRSKMSKDELVDALRSA